MIEKLISAVAEQLVKHHIDYMLIGGQAVLVYGRPRLTRDIDITVGIDTDQFERLTEICKTLNLKPLAKQPKEFADQTRVMPVEDPISKIRVDFIFSFSAYETAAIQRAKDIRVGDQLVKFASCEDVIIHKLIAGRAIDEEDIKSILLKNRSCIDDGYIEKWLTEFALISEYASVLHRWKKLKNE